MMAKLERPRQAVVLAGGRGTRMRPLTDDRPKPMIEFHGRPFLEYLIYMLREQGFEPPASWFCQVTRFGSWTEAKARAAEWRRASTER